MQLAKTQCPTSHVQGERGGDRTPVHICSPCATKEKEVAAGRLACTRVPKAVHMQWSLSMKDTLNKGHLSYEDTVCSPNHIEL